jgi:hypothetical protein
VVSAYSIAWWVILVAALLGAAIFYYLLKNVGKSLLRILAVTLTLVFFLVPAPVPGYAGHFAPAFVVCVFEALFQTEGDPALSLRILVIALGLTGILTWLGHRYLARKSSSAVSIPPV